MVGDNHTRRDQHLDKASRVDRPLASTNFLNFFDRKSHIALVVT